MSVANTQNEESIEQALPTAQRPEEAGQQGVRRVSPASRRASAGQREDAEMVSFTDYGSRVLRGE